MATRLQRADQPKFLLGRDAGEDSGALGNGREVFVGDFLQLATREGDKFPVLLATLQPDLAGNGARGDKVVAGDHLHRDAGALALTDGRDAGRARRIHHPLQPEEGEPGVVVGVFEFGVMCLHMSSRQSQHAQPARGHRFSGAMHGGLVEWHRFAIRAERVGAAFKQAFERAYL